MNNLTITALVSLTAALTTASAQATVTKFRAELDASVVRPQTDPDHSQSTATGVAEFVLNYDENQPAATTLSYNVLFLGLDVAPTDNANLFDDITAIHIHDTTVCANNALCGDGMGGQIPGSTVGTRHVLNLLGAPRNDDANLVVFADDEQISGLWDPSDANNLSPAPSQSIADPAILQLLFSGKLALMVHTNLVASGEIGGFIRQVPEPGTLAVAGIASALAIVTRRR